MQPQTDQQTPKIIAETERLFLREIVAEDLDFMATMLGDAEVMRFWPRPLSREESETEIRNRQSSYATHGCGFWLVTEKKSGQPVGEAGILIRPVNGVEEAVLAYKTHRPFWRNGYAHEAARACLDHAFGALARTRVVTMIRPENVPSMRLAEKLGMNSEGTMHLAGFHHVVLTLSK